MQRTLAALLRAAAILYLALPASGEDRAVAHSLTATVEAMKHSVARLVCGSSLESPNPSTFGSGFFVSSSGTFLTAAHVISGMEQERKLCRFVAVAVPADGWNPHLRETLHILFEFRISDCKMDIDLDVARCRTIEKSLLPRGPLKFAIQPVRIGKAVLDGSEVAFTGFPLGVRDPMTTRAIVSASRTVWVEGKPQPELLLDRPCWPGSSGSPVFLDNGSVVGIVVGTGTGTIENLTLARPIESLGALLDGEK